MKKNLRKIAVVGLGLAGAIGAMVSIPSISLVKAQQIQEQKAARVENIGRKNVVINNHYSGLDIETIHPNYGLSPKEYGQRYGNGKSNIKKSNRNRLGHNAKLKRRA
ncbi:hypothetical protein [Pedobacter arcticus]|uniref:hypothetical protein n=1 Tax=Pedobacter arcticus TaxID=752140 RepID=UPI0002D420EE|nr:hypothetical protein [Pedobacter arcticus]